MEPLAIVGLAESRAGIFDTELEVWTINDADYTYGIPRISRLFDIHKPEELIGRWDRLISEPRDYPVYLPEAYPDIPNSIRYPIEWVTREVFANLYVGERQAEYYSCSFPYMLALAVLEGRKDIRVFGFEFGSDTEYRYQREGVFLLLGWAAARGARIEFPEGSGLLPRTLYGYEDYMNVSRQHLESLLSDLSLQHNGDVVKFNTAHNLLITKRQENGGASSPEIDALADARSAAYKEVFLSSGGLQIVDHLIKECDRRAGELELRDPLRLLEVDGKPVE